ncbi:MAG: hypothetical protein U0905_17585 [Pirellulales bacterium]
MSIAISPEYLLWYLPLVVAISLVLAATRHERQDLIFVQAWRNGVWITSFMGIISALLWVASWWI